jgi:hypothetical protein
LYIICKKVIKNQKVLTYSSKPNGSQSPLESSKKIVKTKRSSICAQILQSNRQNKRVVNPRSNPPRKSLKPKGRQSPLKSCNQIVKTKVSSIRARILQENRQNKSVVNPRSNPPRKSLKPKGRQSALESSKKIVKTKRSSISAQTLWVICHGFCACRSGEGAFRSGKHRR